MDDCTSRNHVSTAVDQGWAGWEKPRVFRAPVGYRIDARSRLVGVESTRCAGDGTPHLHAAAHLQVIEGVLQPTAEQLQADWSRTIDQVFATRMGQLFVLEGCPRWLIAAVVPTDDRRVAAVRMTKGLLQDGASLVAVISLLNLTPREADVFALLLDGIPPKRVAQKLCTSVTTVRSQIQAILSKSGHRSMRELLWMMACMPSVEQLSVMPVAIEPVLPSRPVSVA